MNFKEALIAHLQGEKVECKDVREVNNWKSFADVYGNYALNEVVGVKGTADEFRLAPRTIFVNGVEVPSPESAAPVSGVFVYVADPTSNNYQFCVKWVHGNEQCSEYLERGLVYLNKDDAIARAKAMLLTQSN